MKIDDDYDFHQYDDEEVDNEQVHDLINSIELPDFSIRLVDPRRVNELCSLYKQIKEVITGEDAVYNFTPDDKWLTSVHIIIIGKSLVVRDAGRFLKILQNASASEMLPKTDRKIEMNLTFYDVTLEQIVEE